MSISNPNKLVEEFKKSGEFDRIRRELLSEFQSSEGLAAFKSHVEDVARRRLTNDHNLLYMPQEFIHRELMQELERFPIVERSTSGLPMLNDPALSSRISGPLEKLLQDQGIPVKVKQTDQEKHSGLSPNLHQSDGSVNKGDKDSAPSDEEDLQDKSESTKEQGVSFSPSSQAEQKPKDKDPDSMDVDMG